MTPTEQPDRRSTFSNVLLVGSLLILAVVLWPIWQPLLLATILAGALTPLQNRLVRLVRGRRHVAAALMTVAVVVLIVTPLAAIAVIAVEQAVDIGKDIRDAVAGGQVHQLLRPLPDKIERWLQPVLERVPEQLKTLRRGGPGEAGRWAAVQVQSIVVTVSTFAFDLAMMLIALFFLLADGHRLVDWAKKVSPMGPGRTDELLEEFQVVSRSVIGANMVTGAAQAVAATMGYWLAKVPQPIFFGLLTLLTSFIPSVGTAVVSMPLVLLLYLLGHPVAALFLLVWSLMVVALIDNFLRPMLISAEMNTHGALVFFVIIGGIGVFGIGGLVVGPLALAMFLTMVRFHRRDVRGAARAAASASAAE